MEITKNFETKIGKGGFGPVYHGYMKDGTQVAVKMLSPSSSQGPREFQTEVCDHIEHKNFSLVKTHQSNLHYGVFFFFIAGRALVENSSQKLGIFCRIL